MKIVFTGGGTGGHFYPLIAIAESLNDLCRERRLIAPQLYFLAPEKLDEKALFENAITFVSIPAGKVRRYASLSNVTGFITTFIGTIKAVLTLFQIYPDVVVSKGGYGSVPTTMAARILRIPLIIHESDAKPGRANLLASKWAAKIAISFDSAADLFPAKVRSKIARTGIPIRRALTRVESEGAREYLKLEPGVPTILVLGGSLGSKKINETIVAALPDLVSFANVIHQTGNANFEETQGIAKVTLEGNEHAGRYHPFNYLAAISLQRAAGVADIVVSRAGSTTIAEISVWKKPSIIIPISEAVSHDQRSNAFAYARTGAALVLEEANLTPHLLASEIRRIVTDKALAAKMSEHAAGFSDADAANILAEEVVSIALSHE